MSNNLRFLFSIFVLLILVAPTPGTAQHEDCQYCEQYFLQLWHCSDEQPMDLGYEECEAAPNGLWCDQWQWCPGYPGDEELWPDGSVALASLQQGWKESPEAAPGVPAPSITDPSSWVVRRQCDGAIVHRSYPVDVAQSMKESVRIIGI